MQKTLIWVVAAAAIAAAIYAMTRPEPTPAERLSDAAQEAGEAAKDAVQELANAAEDTLDAVQNEAEASMSALSAELTAASEETRTALEGLVQDWQDTGIITENGLDFDAATAAINEADLDDSTKAELNGLLAFIRDLPGETQAKMDALKDAL